MAKFKYILNLVFGGLGGYAYIMSVGYVLAYTPLQSVLKDCRLASRADSCGFVNLLRLLASDFIHYLFSAVVVAIFIGTLQKLIARRGPPYQAVSFSVGFLILWLWASWPFVASPTSPGSWYIFSTQLLFVAMFVVIYHLGAMYVFKIKMPNPAFEPTP